MNPRDLSNKIKDLFIVREYDGSYNLFGRYLIKPSEDGLYEVSFVKDEGEKYTFSSLKNAVTWCVFEKNKKYKEIKHIQDLDNILGSLDVSIAQHKKLAEKVEDIELKDIFLAKLYEEKLKKRVALEQMNEYVNISKYWQTKKFAENQAR